MGGCYVGPEFLSEATYQWLPPSSGSEIAGSTPLVFSGWLTSISGLDLGAPTSVSGPGSCDLSTLNGALTIS
jgi:hypothetical protein